MRGGFKPPFLVRVCHFGIPSIKGFEIINGGDGMPTRIVVLGAGPGGYVAAIRAAQLGADVTVIERDNVGGTCLNWGCIPSKIMKTTAEMLEHMNRASEFGIQSSVDIRLDMHRLAARKKQVIQVQRDGILKLLKHNGVNYLYGDAEVTAVGSLSVTLDNGESAHVSWDKLIIATGSRPRTFENFPYDGEKIISSNDALYLEDIPESMLILGGGVIGCEFASIFSALGCKVTLVEALSRLLPLPSVDGDCSKILQREMKKRKIKYYLEQTATAAERTDSGIRVTIYPFAPGNEKPAREIKPETIEAEKMLICIGRQPNTSGIGLEGLGVAMDQKGWILADESLETNVPGVYAIGDVLGPSKIMLAHVASTEGIIAAENAMGVSRKMDYGCVPGAIFTIPEVANVGLTESQATEQGFDVRSDTVLFRTLGKAQVIGEIAGQAKIVSTTGHGKIVGVHIIGPHAADLIAEGTLAVKMGTTVSELAETIHAHPTLSEIMLETSFRALDRGLHS